MIRSSIITLLLACCPSQISRLVPEVIILPVKGMTVAWSHAEIGRNVRSKCSEIVPLICQLNSPSSIVFVNGAILVCASGFYPFPDAVDRGFFVWANFCPPSRGNFCLIAAAANGSSKAVGSYEANSTAITLAPPNSFMAAVAHSGFPEYSQAVKLFTYRVFSYSHRYSYSSVGIKGQPKNG